MIHLAGTDFSHLTSDELIKGIKALDLPDYIRSKAYGIDVRETLAQMTEMTIQLGVNMGLSPEDALKWARKLQETVSQSEFDSWVATLLDGGPSIFMNTLNELKATYPNGAAGVALVRETDPAKIYVWNGSAWEDFGDYQGIEIKNGTVTTEKIADNAVTPDVTTFAKKGKNIFDGNFEKGISVIGGVPIGTIAEDSEAYIDITKVHPNTKYTVSKSESNRFRIYSSEKYPVVGDKVENLFQADTASAANITTLKDTKYLITYVSNDGLPPAQFQIALGHGNSEYENPNRVAFDLVEKSVETRAIDEKNGVLDGYPDGFNISFKGQTITTSNRGRVTVGKDRFTLKEGVYPISGGNYAGLRIFLNTQTMDITTVPTDTSGNREYDHLVNLGVLNRTEGRSYISGMYQIEGKSVLPFTGVEGTDIIGNNKKTFIPDKPSGAYDFDPQGFNPNANRNYDKLLSIYDGLVADFPEYVTRTKLADEESGLPLYLFKFAPKKTVNGHNHLKILIFVTHGHEVQATYGVAHFLNSLAREWRDDSRLNMIRHNVEILVVPQSNPYGFNLGQRPNYNGVDIARNYPDGWSFNDEPELGYGTHGSEPLSEIGNQVTYQVLLDNLDADFVIDNHNYGGDPASSTSMPLMWLRASNTESEKVVNGHIHQMVGKARLDGYVPMDVRLGGIVSKDEVSYGSLIDQIRNLGLDGTIMENMNTLNGSTDDSNIFKFNTENLGNLIINAVRYYG